MSLSLSLFLSFYQFIFLFTNVRVSFSCLDILPDQCEQGDEEELMYKPFPDCCPVYCNLKRRMQRLKTMHYRHRKLLNLQQQQAQSDLMLGNYNVDDLGFR
uniref:Uncharacterized protein CG1552 n=1 Tax=Bactrocera dorsalis TaxID=27457 RepID=A0A034WSL9_BACDO